MCFFWKVRRPSIYLLYNIIKLSPGDIGEFLILTVFWILSFGFTWFVLRLHKRTAQSNLRGSRQTFSLNTVRENMWLSLEVYRNTDHFCTFIKTLIFFYDKMPTICDLLIFFCLKHGSWKNCSQLMISGILFSLVEPPNNFQTKLKPFFNANKGLKLAQPGELDS